MKEEDDQLYIYKLYGISLPRFMKAEKSLRARIGPNAKISDDQINKAQEIIDNPPLDFETHVMNYLRKIKEAIEIARDEAYLHEDEYNMIVIPMTQIKGQAAMFGNDLASEISAMVLKFLEHYKRLDEDMLILLDAYCKTIHLSYEKKLLNVNTPGGRVLISEISYAMERYTDRFNKKTGR